MLLFMQVMHYFLAHEASGNFCGHFARVMISMGGAFGKSKVSNMSAMESHQVQMFNDFAVEDEEVHALWAEMPSPGVLFLSDLLEELQGHNMALFDLATGGVQTSNH